jgi:outer membrane protein with beta-barrel domain
MPRVGLAVALLLVSSPLLAAEKQVRPFVAVAFKGSTTYALGEEGASKRHGMLGLGVALVGDIVGIEGDLNWGPRFFEPDSKHLVVKSGVTTATGNVIITLPKRLTEYTLRPYFVAGAGAMHFSIDDVFGVFSPRKTLAGYDIGGGAVGYLSNRTGLAWDVRRFGTLNPTDDPGLTTQPGGKPAAGRVSFWRASMALVVRY